MLNSNQIRDDFPLLRRKINNKSIIYLDSAATSLKPTPVLEAMSRYYTEYTANIHRGIYSLSEEATLAYDNARKKVSGFIGSKRSEEVIFTRNTTEALNLVASTCGKQVISSDGEIVTTIIEHHANFVPWQQLAKEKKAKFIVIPIGSDGVIEQDLLKRYITRSTKLFAFSAVSNVLGTIQDVPGIINIVRTLSPDCIIVVDAAQAVPHTKVNIMDWNADFVAFSGHKMLGPTGIGVLWGRYHLLENMPPYQFGGDMIKDVAIGEAHFADPPQKFEAGTPDIAEAIGLGAASEYLTSLGMDNIRRHELELISYTIDRMKKLDGVEIYGPDNSDVRGGVISFTLDRIHPHDIAQILNEDNICIRAGHHCAMPLHTSLKIAATARISFYVYTTDADIEVFIEGLKKVKKIFQ